MPEPLDERTFERLADQELRALETALAGIDGLEADLQSGILTIEFEEDETQFVVNSHRAALQIWLAANRSAWHFDFRADSTRWVAAKDGAELWATITDAVASRLGRPLRLERPA